MVINNLTASKKVVMRENISITTLYIMLFRRTFKYSYFVLIYTISFVNSFQTNTTRNSKFENI